MKRKYLILVVILLAITFSIYFFSFKKYKENLNSDILLFRQEYSSFSFNYFDSQPIDKNDVEKMISWSKYTSDFKGYNIIDSNKILVEYSFEKSKIYYSEAGDKEKLLTEFTFYDYLFNKRKYKFLIGKFLKPIFNCNDYTSNKKPSNETILSRFDLYNKEKSLLGNNNITRKFYKQINVYEKKFNEKIFKPRKLNILWFVYNKGRIKIICKDNFSSEMTKKIVLELESYFNEIESGYFDYSLFALRLFHPDRSDMSNGQ